jgi:hypothetical protein
VAWCLLHAWMPEHGGRVIAADCGWKSVSATKLHPAVPAASPCDQQHDSKQPITASTGTALYQHT